MKKIIAILSASVLIVLANNAFAMSHKQQEINKRNVLAFYEKAINQKDFPAASKYLGAGYIQHNPTALDGPEGLEKFIHFLSENYPNAHSDIKRVFADGNFVILHVHSIREPGTNGRAIFDLFKLNHGKIIEHWDVVQEIPVDALNGNGMF